MRILIVIPALNEAPIIGRTIAVVRAALVRDFPEDDVHLLVVDNGSSDGTAEAAESACRDMDGASVLRLGERGKGLAIREGWNNADADAYVFMDADLATDLSALRPLLHAIRSGADIAIGSRAHRDSIVTRPFGRRLLSAGYRWFLRGVLGTAVGDAPCGFKAVSRRVVAEIVPRVRDDKWFFDTELVIRAERVGYSAVEIPVIWKEPRKRESKVRIAHVATEYIRSVLSLRKALQAKSFNISSSEKWFIAVLAAIAIAATSLPYIVALFLAASRGERWTGLQFLSPGDLSVYLSYIAQVKHGAVLLQNWYTTEPVAPTFNILWFAIGLLARMTGASPLLAYHLARVLLIPAFAASAYVFFAYLFDDVQRRKVATALFLFGSGLGPFFASFFSGADSGPGTYQRPIDLWVGESNAFLTMGYSPHFVASFTLILLSAYFFLRATDRRSWRDAILSGLLGLLLFQFHPFHAPTLLAVFAAYVAWRVVARKGSRDDVTALGLFAAISAPSVLYHYWLTHADAAGKSLLNANLCLTPAFWHVAIGTGAILPFAVWGVFIARRGGGSNKWEFLAVWAAVQLSMLYAPLTFQRRLVEGVEFPLVALAIPAIVLASARLASLRGGKRLIIIPLAATLAVTIFFISSFSAVMTNIELYRRNVPPLFFLSSDESGALDWLKDDSPRGTVVLGAFDSGNRIAGWGERPVYAGHWVNTIDIARKNGEIVRFYGTMDDTERRAFALKNGITFIYWGPKERAFGGNEPSIGFEISYRRGNYAIYRVIK